MFENNQIQLLAMDFDGVIADSILECAVTGYNGYSMYHNKNTKIYTSDDLNPLQLNSFRNTRPYIRSGEDYIYLYQAYDEGIQINNQNDFDVFKKTFIDQRESYYEYFYMARKDLVDNYFNNWIELNPLYEDMKRFLKSVFTKVHIISTKASNYICKILSHYDINLNHSQIHSTSTGHSKSDILLKIMRDNNFCSENALFIDDHLDTLKKMKNTNVQCYLANWGYNTEIQKTTSMSYNIKNIELENFYNLFGEV